MSWASSTTGADADTSSDFGLIYPSGPERCDVLFVGEAGGKSEHYKRRPFVGKAGEVFNAYLLAAGLYRSAVRVTNVFPYWTGEGNPDPTPAQIRSEEHILVAEIKRCKPVVIGAVGRIATQWFLGPDADMDSMHGVPLFSDRAPGCVVVPIYHPAAGFYDPDLAAYSQEDFMRVVHYLKTPPPTKNIPKIVVAEQSDVLEIGDAAVDTEGLEDSAWGLSWATRKNPEQALVCTPGKRIKLSGRITFHNALHDLRILRAMGIDTTDLDYDDTMVKLYNLQLEPQGLKAAAYRHLGLRMTEFSETVRPHFDEVALNWLERAAAAEYRKPESIAIADFTKRKNRVYKPQHVGRRIKNILTAYGKDKVKTKLEKRWAEIGQTNYKRIGHAEKLDFTETYQSQAERAVGEPFPDFSIFCVPRAKAVKYSGVDASATALLEPVLDRLIDAKGLRQVYEMDRRALPFVDRMAEVGMPIDTQRLIALESDLEDVRARSLKAVQRVVGDRWFNPGSADQVARWLYSAKGLPVLTYTDTGRGSTADGSLKMLRGYHSEDADVATFLDSLQEYREADKYLGTFVRPIFIYMKQGRNGKWRLHPNFRVTRVVSGRLSSHEPNVLAFPTRTDLGKRIRALFVARDGWVIVSADFSQLELRVGAHYTRDPKMMAAFVDGKDLHAITASVIFKVALEAVTSVQRYVAKTINFAVFYGITARALLEQLYKADIFDFTLADCERFIAQWFALFASVRPFQDRLWRQAAKDGFVRTMFGRICYVPNLRLIDEKLKAAAQRLAMNFPVQGTGSDTLKRSEIRFYDAIKEGGLRDDVLPILQMHDELVLEVKAKYEKDARELLDVCMHADQRKFRVPIKVGIGSGDSWATAK